MKTDLCWKVSAAIYTGASRYRGSFAFGREANFRCTISPIFHFALLIIRELSTLSILHRFVSDLLHKGGHF